MMDKTIKILGVKVDLVSREEALEKIETWLREKYSKFHLVSTVYSEFLVESANNRKFRSIIDSADLGTPDGGSILAAADYLSGSASFLNGLKTGAKLFSGQLGQTVSGVWLTEELTRSAAKEGWRVFLLGSKPGVAKRLAERLELNGVNVSFDEGEEKLGTDKIKDDEVIKKINDFKTDLLLVAYGPVKQEMWIDAHRDRLMVKVAIGVGGTFDELVGDFEKTPMWMERHNLKWLWRVIKDPRRIGRIWKAVVVFPWMVWRSANRV